MKTLGTIALILGILMATYDPRTGISTYADPTPEAEVPVPSTATAVPAAQSPSSFWSGLDQFAPSSWAGDRGLKDLEYAVSMWRSGHPLPQEVQDFLNSHTGGNDPLDQWNRFVAYVQDKESGGGHGFLGTGISFGDPTLDGMLNFGQGAMWAGNVGGAALTGGDLWDAALQDVMALGSANLAPLVSGAVGGGMLGASAGGLASGGLNALGRGEDLAEGALRGAVGAGALRGGAELYADYLAPSAPSTATTLADTSFDSWDYGFDPKRFGAPVPMLFADSGGTMTDVAPGMMPPAILDTGPVMPPAVLDTGGVGMLPVARPEPDPTFGGALTETAPGVYSAPTMLTDAQIREQRVQDAAKTIERYAKIGRTLAQMNEGRGTPEDAPQRQEGQDDAQYAQTLVQYANLDARTLADAGLTPGTPEYYEFVMSQLDSVINQLTGGEDPDSPNLAAQMRNKTREELIALERALYVRGQIGQLMGSGFYTDPFTGIDEEVIVPEGMLTRPGVAAYHRGLARSTDEIARMSPQEARRFMGGFLERDPDLYGAQAAADARAEEEALAMQDYDWKRRRGMLPFYS